MGNYPGQVASLTDLDSYALAGVYVPIRTTASFTAGNGTIPNYARGLIMNFASSDSTLILVSPTGFIFGFRNNGTWNIKQISF